MARGSNSNHLDGRAFFAKLRDEGVFAPVFMIYGEEEFLIKEAENRLISAAFPDGSDGLNDDQLDGLTHSGYDIVNVAQGAPMFAPMRTVRVRNADRLKAAELELIAEYVERPMETTTLILRGTSFDGRTRAVKSLLASSAVVAVKFDLLSEQDAADWVVRQAARYGLRVARDVPGFMVESVGTSLDLLDAALERVDLYLGGSGDEKRDVRREVVEELIVDTRTQAWFKMTDALLERRGADAIQQFRRAHEFGESAIRTVSRATYQFRSVLLVQEGVKRGLTGKELSAFGECNYYALRSMQRAARTYREGELRWILSRLSETDTLLKSSKHADLVLVERLFLDITRGYAFSEHRRTRESG